MQRKKKTKIVLDADVIIHFTKGECLWLLFNIFPEYEYIILDVVYDELKRNREIRAALNKLENQLKKLNIITFAPKGISIRDYAQLRTSKGAGESACLIYCKDNQDVLGSSNLKDILDFCKQHNIAYLTTLDFLYYAYTRKLMTAQDCFLFVQTVIAKGSILPKGFDVEIYTCNVII